MKIADQRSSSTDVEFQLPTILFKKQKISFLSFFLDKIPKTCACFFNCQFYYYLSVIKKKLGKKKKKTVLKLLEIIISSRRRSAYLLKN